LIFNKLAQWHLLENKAFQIRRYILGVQVLCPIWGLADINVWLRILRWLSEAGTAWGFNPKFSRIFLAFKNNIFYITLNDNEFMMVFENENYP
jgi:hypothetical protein